VLTLLLFKNKTYLHLFYSECIHVPLKKKSCFVLFFSFWVVVFFPADFSFKVWEQFVSF
jgi:hypothetical protein